MAAITNIRILPAAFTVRQHRVRYTDRGMEEDRMRALWFAAMVAAALAAPARAETEFQPTFDKIGAHIIFDKTLRDGKHPAWVYYSWNKGGAIARITVPENNLCLVSVRSKADMDISEAQSISWFEKGSDDWNNAVQAYVIAFERLTRDMQRHHTSLAPECR
jgi:hypothetical protein